MTTTDKGTERERERENEEVIELIEHMNEQLIEPWLDTSYRLFCTCFLFRFILFVRFHCLGNEKHKRNKNERRIN